MQCKKGHPYPENLKIINGKKNCRTCMRENNRRYKRAHRKATVNEIRLFHELDDWRKRSIENIHQLSQHRYAVKLQRY
ncbi:MAG TPA: hypothetical protein VN081_01565 [Dongiaceae bacterium]|nr:hypothetical protein [Dongiaceae bacterium]